MSNFLLRTLPIHQSGTNVQILHLLDPKFVRRTEIYKQNLSCDVDGVPILIYVMKDVSRIVSRYVWYLSFLVDNDEFKVETVND